MGAHEFGWYELRTTNLEAAREFYTRVARLEADVHPGRTLLRAEGRLLGAISPLPERAASQGAPPHWLGHIGVADVEAHVRRFVALGATQLGPTQRSAEGTSVALLRDPLGAIVALSSRADLTAHPRVAWHELHSKDEARAASLYSEMFGWRLTQTLPLGDALGLYQLYTWKQDGTSVGGMSSAARLPGIHPHWLFYFDVGSIDEALADVRALGGRVLNGPQPVSNGARVAQCEDPQGGAFALREAPRPVRG
ncbi:VOC family protein [Myxococcaceae bacterium GXIMD 01537]